MAMEIKDPIHGTIDLNPHEVAVIDSAAYQRLRLIKQLGFSEFSFPGATHNRFLHSLGACHLSGIAFDQIFQGYPFSRLQVRWRFRQCLRLATLLHDIGHGPLSHTTEEVMPSLASVQLPVERKGEKPDRRAHHEDYTLKFILDSSLTPVLEREFSDMAPAHIACLIDRSLKCPDDFFVDDGIDFRPILSQIVSSEVDVDRMDYLERDAYFCGTNYGKIETNWLLPNFTYHQVDNRLYLALNRRALYTFDDFLISRHHMHLMVYFHHKSIIYEEMLHRYLTSDECSFFLPADIEEYIQCTDYALYEHLRRESNPWARRIASRQPYRVLYEMHVTSNNSRPLQIAEAIGGAGIDVIHASSKVRLSKYHTSMSGSGDRQIYVVDQYDPSLEVFPIDQTTRIFQRYEEERIIERLYVAPEEYYKAEKIKNSIVGK